MNHRGAVIKALASYWGNEISDPVKVAQLILRLAESERLPAHLYWVVMPLNMLAKRK